MPPSDPTHGDIRQGFVYERAPHVTLKSIANNAEIDVIWETWQQTLEPLREKLNTALGERETVPRRTMPARMALGRMGIPREPDDGWPDEPKKLHAAWWEGRIARQKEIDDPSRKKADVEMLYDRPYEDNGKVRVAGPFTVESLSPTA